MMDTQKTHCPFTKICENDNNSEDEREGIIAEERKDPPKPVPAKWFDIGFLNILKFASWGQTIIKDRMDYHDSSTVFAMNFNEQRVLLCDHVAVQSVFDSTKVAKEASFGFMYFNQNLTKPYLPCIFQNGDTHDRLKAFILKFVHDLDSEASVSRIIELVQREFENMASVDFSSDKTGATEYDVEWVLKKAVANVIWHVLLGEYPDDPQLIYDWLNETLSPRLGLWFKSEDDEKIQKAMNMIRKSKKMQGLKNSEEFSDISHDDKLSQLLFTTIFNAIGGMATIVISALASIFRLNDGDKELLKNDADKLIEAGGNSWGDVFKTLTTVHSFYLEVLRMYPPVPSIYGRATCDFNIESTSGTFSIKKGTQLCASVVLMHRDKNTFENPETFVLNRPVDDLERYNIEYGGFFRSPSTNTNHKCAGMWLANTIAKTFIVYLTQCTVVPETIPVHTFSNAKRLEGSDQPLKILKFRYEGKE